MSIMDCIGAVRNAVGGKITDDEALDLLSRVEELSKKARAEGDISRAGERLRELGRSEADKVKRAAALQRKQAALNSLTRDAIAEHVEVFKKAGFSPEKALTSLLVGTQKRVQGARKSVWAWRQAYEGRYMGPLLGRLVKERPHLEKLLAGRDWLGRVKAEAKAFDDLVAREMEQIGKADGTPGLTRNEDARFVANLLSDAAELARRDLNALGADIGKLEGWLPHRHDADRVRTVKRDEWVATIKPLLDLDRTFPDTPDERIDSVLQEIWGNIVSGKDSIPGAREKGERVGPANLAKSLGKERVLHFASTDSYLTYNRRFGYGTTVATVFQHLRQSAQKAGLMKVLGPNPEVMFGSVTAEASRQARQADPTDAMAQNLDKATGWASWKIVSGQADMVQNQRLANIGSGIRTWEQLSKLMGAVLSAAPTDPVMMANALRFQGKGLVSSYADVFGKYFSGRGKGQEREVAFLLNEGYEGLFDALVTPYAAQEGETGRLSKLARIGFRLQGLTGFTDVGRSVGARVMAADFGKLSAKGFDQLGDRYRNVLTLQGITADRWEAIRRAAWEGEGGRTYLTPEQIRDLPDDVIEPLAAGRLEGIDRDKKPETVTRILDETRQELELDLRRLYADEIGFGIIETDDASRVISTAGGTQRGTVGGEAARLMLQFKGFPIAFSQRTLGRRLLASPGATKGTRILNGTLHMGELLATLTVAGLFATWAKDIAKGKSPKSLTERDGSVNYKTLMAGFLQGGGAGIYGDFFFAESNRFGRSALATLGGPAVGDFEGIYNSLVQAKNGEPKASQALNTALGLTPFINLWYTRHALDYLVINSLKESVSPGYMRRSEKRMRDDYGQRPLSEALLEATR